MKGAALVLAMTLAGCATALPVEVPPVAEGAEALPAPRYLGVQTMRLDDDLVAFRVGIDTPRASSDIDGYTDCAAAQYALIRGMGYARHVRTNIDDRGGAWVADAVYMLSADKPRGEDIIEAEPTVADCKAQSIPAV